MFLGPHGDRGLFRGSSGGDEIVDSLVEREYEVFAYS